MEVLVPNNKLRRALADAATCKRSYGANMAAKIRLRLAALDAAESLADFWPPNSGPERCHELKGELSETFSMDLKQPYRLLFKAVGDEDPPKPLDDQERWRNTRTIEIIGIKDTHG